MGWLRVLLVVVATLSLAGCEAIGDIFKAGVWTGVIMVVLILTVIGFVAGKLRR